MRVSFLQYQTWPTGRPPPIKDEIAKAIERRPDIILGPEYLLNHSTEARVFDKKQKNNVFKSLADMTSGTATVLIPGTIVWKEEFPGCPFGGYHNTAAVFADGRIAIEFDKASVPASDKALARILNCLLLPETKHYDQARLERYIGPRSATIAGSVYMVEICADHYYAADAPGRIPKIADIQVLVSSGRGTPLPPEKLFVKEGGLFIMCNGQLPSMYIGRVEGGLMIEKYRSEYGAGVNFVEY